MPLVYRGDPLSEQLCDAFDDVLAPIFATLDSGPVVWCRRRARRGWRGHVGRQLQVLEDPHGGRRGLEHGDQPEPTRGTQHEPYWPELTQLPKSISSARP